MVQCVALSLFLSKTETSNHLPSLPLPLLKYFHCFFFALQNIYIYTYQHRAQLIACTLNAACLKTHTLKSWTEK